MLRAGFLFRTRNAGRAWVGDVNVDANGTITNLVDWGSPIFEAGLDQGDVILEIDGQALSSGVSIASALQRRKPGDTLRLGFRRRGGATGVATVQAVEDPSLDAVPIESGGGTLTADQRAFRQSWLGSRVGR
jgi:S1-C subfamily serine protease